MANTGWWLKMAVGSDERFASIPRSCGSKDDLERFPGGLFASWHFKMLANSATTIYYSSTNSISNCVCHTVSFQFDSWVSSQVYHFCKGDWHQPWLPPLVTSSLRSFRTGEWRRKRGSERREWAVQMQGIMGFTAWLPVMNGLYIAIFRFSSEKNVQQCKIFSWLILLSGLCIPIHTLENSGDPPNWFIEYLLMTNFEGGPFTKCIFGTLISRV